MNKILKYQGAGKLISLIDDIVKAAKSSPIDFSDWGKLHRSDMLKIPGNTSIVSKLSDSELGYLLYNRNGQILNGTSSRYAIFTGSDPMSVKRINIFDSPGRNTGYLIPEYLDVVPGTVSTHYVENLTGGLSKGISEDSYNALMNITGKPLSANRIWKMPEITEKVYKKFTPGISNPQFKMMQHKLIDQVGSSGKPAGWSSQKWQEELEWMKKRADIDAGIQDGDELFNTIDDFYEDVMRTPVEAIRPVIQGTTRFVPTKHEFLFQINPQTIKNGTPVVNWSDPSIWLKNGGRIAKYQMAGWIGKGLKWLLTKGDDAIKSVKSTHAIKSFNKGITQSKSAYQFHPGTGSFNFVIETKPFDYKFKHVKDLSDSEIKVLYDDLKTSGIITPEFEFAIGKQYNPYFTYSIKPIDPKDAFRVSMDLPGSVNVSGKRSPEILESAIKEWFDVHYNPNKGRFYFDQLFPYVDHFSATPVNLQRILVDQALDASKSIDYVSKSMHANNFLKKGLSDFHVPSFKFTVGGLGNSANYYARNQIELGFSPTNIVKEFDPDTKQWFKFSLPETIAHETAHSNTLFNTQGTNIKRIKTESPEYKMDYIFVPKRWKKLLSPSATKINTHDLEFAEGYSDLWGMRKSMYDMGIGTKASFDPGVRYNYWDLFKYKITPKGMRDRFIKQRGGWWGGWKQQLSALNEIYKNGGIIK